MDFTVIISEKYAVLPFEVLKQDKDEVIMLVNYYILKGDESDKPQQTKPARRNDGFWDF